MNLTFTDEQQLLADTARRFVTRGSDHEWTTIAAAGWPGLAPTELAIVCEELGRGPVASPLIVSSTAARLLEWYGTDGQRERFLPALVTGECIGTVAILEPGMRHEWDAPGRNRKILVPWADRADVIVAATADGLALVEDAEITRHDALGEDPLAIVEWEHAEPMQAGTLDRALDHAAVASLAYAVGVAEGALALTVQHARDRHQFGRPIGSFQAVAHRCADMRSDIDACRLLARQAAWALDRGDATLPVAAAKSYANEALRRVFLHAHQVHGAIGFSTEHALHRYTTRLKAFELTYGSTALHRERLAGAMGLQG